MSKTLPSGATTSIVEYQLEKLQELRTIYKSKHCFSEDELHTLKLIVKDLPYFKEVQPNIRNDVLLFFDVVELKQNEILLKKEALGSSVYVLVSGSLKKSIHAPWNVYKEEEDQAELDLISLRENFSTIEGFKVFGDFDILNLERCQLAAQKWKPCFIYALAPSVIFSLNYDKVTKYMEKVLNSQQLSEKMAFLTKTVPGIDNMLTSNKDKIVQQFQIAKFLPGQVILKEGTQPSHCHIIIEGQCALVSNQIPVHMNMMEEDPKKAINFFAKNRGYFSQTMNSFQLGIVGEHEWLGEEMLLMPFNEKLQYHPNLHKDDIIAQQKIQQQSQPQHKQNGMSYLSVDSLAKQDVAGKPPSTAQSNATMESSDQNTEREQQKQQLAIKIKQQQLAIQAKAAAASKKATQVSKPAPGTYLNYSVVAKTEVVTYCLSRDDLEHKCPKDMQSLILRQGKKKQEWIDKRYKDIQSNAMKIYNMEVTHNEYFEKSKEANKLYPQASKNALRLISELHLRKTSIDAKPLGDGFETSEYKSFDQNQRGQNVVTSQSLNFLSGSLQKSFSQQQLKTMTIPKRTIEMKFQSGGGSILNLKQVPIAGGTADLSIHKINSTDLTNSFLANPNGTSFLPDISLISSPSGIAKHLNIKSNQVHSMGNHYRHTSVLQHGNMHTTLKSTNLQKSQSLAKLSQVTYSPNKRDFSGSISVLDQTMGVDNRTQMSNEGANQSIMGSSQNGATEKLLMGAASSYKFTKDKKVCFPTLTKNVETDKVTQIVCNKSRKFNFQNELSKHDQSLNDVINLKFKEANFGEKKIRFMNELISPTKRGSVFYGKS